MSNYWYDRIIDEQEKVFHTTEQQANKELLKRYNQALKDTKRDISDLFDDIIKEAIDGEIRPNDLYKFNRLFQMRSNLNRTLQVLGKQENDIFEKTFLGMYQLSDNIIFNFLASISKISDYKSSSFTMEQEQAAKKVIDSIWCADGKHWSDRIWRDKDRLQQRIEKGLFDNVSRGISKDRMVEELINDFNVEFHSADRIMRTELTYVQNSAASNRYQSSGVDRYKIVAALDDRTSQECREANGKIYKFSEAVVGETMPPLHTNCRSTIIPIIE